MSGPGRFYITGRYSRFIQTRLLGRYLHEMVTMSPLQGSVFEVIETTEEAAVIGAGVNAWRSFSIRDGNSQECRASDTPVS
jgi:hypothetical protein